MWPRCARIAVALLAVTVSTVSGQWYPYCEIELDFKIMCYYTNWAQYRSGIGRHTVADIDPCLCTHILFAFANIVNNDIVPIEGNDIEMYAELRKLKVTNANLKLILAVGGDVMGMEPFEKIVSTETNRRAFAENSLDYLKLHHFDGLDVDWEFPLGAHRINFTELLKVLRAVFHDDVLRFGGPERQLICALAAQKDIMEKSYDLPAIAKYVDYANIMTYDLHGGWDPVTGFHSALTRNPDFDQDPYNQKWVIGQYLNLGFPAAQMTLGIPMYGRSFTLANYSHYGVGDPALGHGQPGPQTGTNGTLAYYEICLKPDMRYEYDQGQEMPYAHWFELWVGYDNETSVQEKKEYANNLSLAGVMIWDLSMDDFSNQCGMGNYPLLSVFNPHTSGTPALVNSCCVLFITVLTSLLWNVT